MKKKSISISIPFPALMGLVVAVALFATRLSASSLLPVQPPSALASYSMEQARQRGQGAPLSASAGTAFTYQGSLKSGGTPANGPHDFRFTLYDAASNGAQVGVPVLIDSVEVAQGLFTVPSISARTPSTAMPAFLR